MVRLSGRAGVLGVLTYGLGCFIVGQFLFVCFTLITVPRFMSLLVAVAADDILFGLPFLLLIVVLLIAPFLVRMRCRTPPSAIIGFWMSSASSIRSSGVTGGDKDVRGVLPKFLAKFGSEELGMKFIATVNIEVGEISKGEFVGHV